MKLYNEQGNSLVDVDTSKEINRGGEGTIYEYPNRPTEVIKVYHTNGTLSTKVLTELMQLPNNFIKPLELFYDKQKRIKGLSMKYLDTHQLVLLSNIFNKASALKAGFTDKIKETIYANMCNSLLEAHRAGIIIGDLNPYNIFVSTKGEIYFIDVDSFQTSSRKHSGTMLPEIRDWLFQDVTEKSDYFAASIMTFQLFTHVHPYKGIHKTMRTLEERMLKRVSLLSGDKDLIIPSFFEPFAERGVNDEFYEIFQKDGRYLPNIGKGQVFTKAFVPKSSLVQSITEGDLVIKTIALDVEDFDCTNSYFYARKDTDQFTVYQCKAPGSYTRHREFTAHRCLLGDSNVVYVLYDRLYNATPDNAELIHNFIEPFNSFMFYQAGKAIYFDGSTDTYSLLNIDDILNTTRINYHKEVIYTKSITVHSGILQNVLGTKWIIDIGSGMKILRTMLNISDVYMCPSGKYGVLELISNNLTEHHLFSVTGMSMKLELKLDGMLRIAEKGDYLYFPSNGAMEVYRKLNLARVATIACKYVNEQSVLKACNAGILCFTGTTLYLLNKV